MTPYRAARPLAVTLALAMPLLTPAAASAAPTPKPSPLPAAQSWVGGQNLIGTQVLADLEPGTPAPPQPKAGAWLVADLNTRSVIAARRVHVPLAPASTMKIFTSLALAPRLDARTIYTAQDDDANVDGTKVGLVPGSRYTVDQLLHGLIMASGNDCANALGNLTGGQAQATALMQQEATKLGAFDTVVRTTSGLDAPGQASSAYDLALAGAAALDDPQLAKIMRTTAYTFPGAGKKIGKGRAKFQIQSHNRLLRNMEGATGVKNGYTVAARGSFVGSATRGGHTYLAVVLRAEGNTWHESRDLLEWAFRSGAQAQPVGRLVKPGELPAKVGPAVGTDGHTLSAAGGPAPSPVGPDGSGDLRGNLRGALPAASNALTAPVADSPAGKGWLTAALIAMTLLVGLIGGHRVAVAGRAPSAAGRHRS
jgi:serine-type D-Ala-D-Ala carboxypeptidase (penicillin-binding protein 5/6)